MTRDYERHLARLEKTDNPLGIGDLRAFIEASKAQPVAEGTRTIATP
jgi:hypothetical protein